jgi:signal transduction histidine kinase
VNRSRRAAAALLALLLLLWLDGWFAVPAAPRADARVPSELSEAFSRAAAELSDRAAAFAARPEVARSLQGGGVVVDRPALFAAARLALEGAPAGCWIALTDPAGRVHAWWGEAPSPVPRLLAGEGFSALWSATTLSLVYRRSVGEGPAAGIVSAARVLPARAPDFAAALGVAGRAGSWRPVGRVEAPELFRDGQAFVGVSPASSREQVPPPRGLALLTALLAALALVRSRSAAGASLLLAFLYLVLTVSASGEPRALASPTVWPLAVGVAAAPIAIAGLRRPERETSPPTRTALGYGLLIVSSLAAARIEPPELTAFGQIGWRALCDLAGLIALVVSALAFRASGTRPPRDAQRWLTAAVAFTTLTILGSLALVSPRPAMPAAVLLLAIAAFELWARAVGPRGEEPFVLPRLLAGAALLLVLIVSPVREHARVAEAFRVAAAVRLPDPQRPSTGAVAAAQRAASRIARFDLRRDLPAPPEETDLSDLAYRIWRDGSHGPEGRSLISYEISDSLGNFRSRFSLIPEAENSQEAEASEVRIDRFRLAIVRRRVPLFSGGGVWGFVRIDVADWPSWDPLPPRIGVYRRLVLGAREEAGSAAPPRPLLAHYGLDGDPRDEGPSLSGGLLTRLRRAEAPVRARFSFRGEDLCGELRPARDGYRLVAIPLPNFFGRLLTAALLIPGIVIVYFAGTALLLARLIARTPREGLLPRWARTFRGRLIALFVLGVLVPIFAVTFFLRAQIVTRSQRETVDHARTALSTARRVLDDYLPSAGAGRGRLGLLDDSLIAWLANAVGYDLSVYGPEGGLVATSRRDLYSAGLVPDRAPASVYVSVGLSGARQQEGSRRVAGSRFEELTTALSAVPGVPGLTSPGLLSLLLLPQQEVAAAEAAQLTAAVWSFSVLVFLLSAAIAGRLAVRVARPVADLVEGTRAVAAGDFSPRLAEPPDEELKELVHAFLSMSRSLKSQTEAVSREKERLATLLSNLTAGVVALGEGGRVLLANPAAVALGGGGRAEASTVDEIFPGDAMRAVRAVLRESPERPITAEVEPRPGERWRIVSVPLPLAAEGDRMAVIEDLSDVVRSNRLAAWAEMARIIAHEIKNPLTPIRLSVEHLREVWRRGSPDFEKVLEECVANVLRQTEELRRSASEFSDYSRLPGTERRRVDLAQFLRDAAAAFAGAPSIRWTVEAPAGAVTEADPRLIARVFSNLIGNSVEALGARGGRIALRVGRDGSRNRVTIEDDGPGVAAEILPRLFEPYFSARSGGTGLGLAIVKKIIEEHGGTISAENRREGGFRVTFDLPFSEVAEAGREAS